MGLEPGTTKARRPPLPGELEQGRQRHPRPLEGLPPEAGHGLDDPRRRAARPRLDVHLRAAVGQRRVRHVPVAGRRPRGAVGPAGQGRARRTSTRTSTSSSSSSTGRRTSIRSFKEHNYVEPIVDAECSGPGYTDRWIDYGRFDGEQLVSAKELTVDAGREVRARRTRAPAAGSRCRAAAGSASCALQTPVMIRFGEEPWDEVFITARSGGRRRRDREHRRRAAGRPALLRPGRAQEHAGDRGSPEEEVRLLTLLAGGLE